MAYSINFNEEKNELLKANRGVCFDDVVEEIRSGRLLDDIKHPSPKRPNQRIYIIKINNYCFAIPYVVNHEKQEIFLKTIYPNRSLTKFYLGRRKK